MASEVSICNRAIQRVGGTRIASLTDATKAARECSTAYEPSRDSLLRSYTWSFAIGRANLAADIAVPVFNPPGTQYTFPSDALRILIPNDFTCDWIIEGRKILSDWAAPLAIRYIKKITDPNEMDALFREALSMKIAHAICEPITGSNTKQAAIRQDFTDVIAEARRTNGIEKLADEPPECSWITVRS
jgi:hypothetical protein